MNLSFAKQTKVESYGTVAVGYQNTSFVDPDLDGIKSGVGAEDNNKEAVKHVTTINVTGDSSVYQYRCCLDLHNVSYVIKQWMGPWWKGACFRKVRQKRVLNDVTIRLKSGEITAILGNSGSGKTSLLDVIAGRSCGRMSGDIYYNNTRCTRALVQEHATYVMQADRLLPNLTVRETLAYTARLKLPGTATTSQIDRKVSQVILDMGLKDVADSRIGSSIIRGISGGEQRRVTIAIQLLKDPDMVFLDEPTSGLDSHTARYLISNLRDLARRGKIVLLTIHQPSSDIFHLFDQIGIMSVGEMVYCGQAEHMVSYFTRLGYPCDRYTNPLDKYVDVASIDRRDKDRETESLKRVGSLVEAFRNSKLHNDTLQAIANSRGEQSNKRTAKQRGASYSRVFATVLSRMYRNLFRDRKDYIARIFLLPLFFVFILIFLGHLKHNQASIQDRIGLLYQSLTVPPFMGIINSVALFPCLRELYYRERRDGLYGSVTFLFAYTIHILPFHIVSSCIFSSFVYWVVGMNPEVGRFWLYTLEIFILHFWGEILTVGIMGLFMHPIMANSVAALVQAAVAIISSGFLKNLDSLNKPLQWLSWGLMHRYSGEIFIANEFHGLQFECPQNQTNVPCLRSGDEYIQYYYPGAVDNITRNFLVIGAFAIGTLILSIIAYEIRGNKNLH